jgi:hypothetical protein
MILPRAILYSLTDQVEARERLAPAKVRLVWFHCHSSL